MTAYRRVYDSRHLQADCQEPGSAAEPYTLGNRVWATFFTLSLSFSSEVGPLNPGGVQGDRCHSDVALLAFADCW